MMNIVCYESSPIGPPQMVYCLLSDTFMRNRNIYTEVQYYTLLSPATMRSERLHYLSYSNIDLSKYAIILNVACEKYSMFCY